MKLKLEPDLTADVLALTSEYGYVPDEIISIGIALATVLLKERGLGNRVVVITPNGDLVSEFREVEPKAIYQVVKHYVEGLCAGPEETSPALLVARLERERDLDGHRL
jgi:hypothetical protein